jgi:hypothetical protein
MTIRFTDEQISTYDNFMFELRHPKKFGQPIIIDDYTYSEKDHYHVYVIWDAWESHPPRTRSEIIMEAYYALDSKKAQYILQTTGLTVEEAWKQGFLPFGLEPRKHRKGDPPLAEYVRIMIETEASNISGFDLPQLRFHTLEEVEATYDYLTKILPHSRWLISASK